MRGAGRKAPRAGRLSCHRADVRERDDVTDAVLSSKEEQGHSEQPARPTHDRGVLPNQQAS